MKTKLLRTPGLAGLMLILVLVLSAWTNNPQGSTEPRLITVTGEAEIRVVPDEVILTLGIETWDKSLSIAKSRNDEIAKKLFALATTYSIDSKHIQTDYINIEPRYRDGYYEQSDFIGYFVRKTVVITLRDLSQFEDLLADALAAGATHVQGIEFRTTELRKHRDQARTLAIRAAREKAEAMAAELGQKIGAPTAIREEPSGWFSGYGAWWGSPWGNSMTQNTIQETPGATSLSESSLAPGQINITARVTVSFELKK